MGCRLTVRMRKASHEKGTPPEPPASRPVDVKGSVYKDSWDSSEAPAGQTNEAKRVDRVLDLARRVGLPPALSHDLDAFWDDPIRTVNPVGGSSGLELASLQTHGHLHSQPQMDLETDVNEDLPHPSSTLEMPISDIEGDMSGPSRISSFAGNFGTDGRSSLATASSIWKTDMNDESNDERVARTFRPTISLQTWADLEWPDRPLSGGHEGEIWGIQWTPANQVLSIGADGKAILWDPANGSPVRALNPHPLALISSSVDDAGGLALINSIEGTTYLWNLTNGDVVGKKESFERRSGAPEPAWSVSLHPQGATYATSNASGSVNIFSAVADTFGDHLRSIPTSRSKFGMCVKHSPDGQRIALSTEAGAIYIFDIERVDNNYDKRLVLHDVRTASGGGKPGGGMVASLSGHSSWVLSVSLAADGRAAASGSADRTVKIWDLAARACVSTIQEQGEIWGVSWRPNAGFGTGAFVSPGSEGCVRFWRSAGAG
ncbi:hypothetical protein FRB98_008777 [Tulasnella sp. 332]|nr:hypothetical protein FRB98_008777 [Tulasnella sp. 332]